MYFGAAYNLGTWYLRNTMKDRSTLQIVLSAPLKETFHHAVFFIMVHTVWLNEGQNLISNSLHNFSLL
jgi:hypothetical protein